MVWDVLDVLTVAPTQLLRDHLSLLWGRDVVRSVKMETKGGLRSWGHTLGGDCGDPPPPPPWLLLCDFSPLPTFLE